MPSSQSCLPAGITRVGGASWERPRKWQEGRQKAPLSGPSIRGREGGRSQPHSPRNAENVGKDDLPEGQRGQGLSSNPNDTDRPPSAKVLRLVQEQHPHAPVHRRHHQRIAGGEPDAHVQAHTATPRREPLPPGGSGSSGSAAKRAGRTMKPGPGFRTSAIGPAHFRTPRPADTAVCVYGPHGRPLPGVNLTPDDSEPKHPCKLSAHWSLK